MIVQNTLLRSIYIVDLDNWEIQGGGTMDLTKKFSKKDISKSKFLKMYLRKKWLIVKETELERETLDEIEAAAPILKETVINIGKETEKRVQEAEKSLVDHPIVGGIYTQATLPKKNLTKVEVKKWRFVRNLKTRLEVFKQAGESLIREAIAMEVSLELLHKVQEDYNEVMAYVMKNLEQKVKKYDERIGVINA